jgi:hypothetical protein
MINRLLTRFAVKALSMNRTPALLCAITGLLITAGCSGSPVTPVDQGLRITGNATDGLLAFTRQCAGCHSSGDALDLAYFAFPDTTIVRRAVAHVDTATAHDIVAYVRTVRALPGARDVRLFQPGGRQASGDTDFALILFGADAWPSDLTATELAALNPLDVPVAIGFPVWSVEFSNVDWMPNAPIDSVLLDHPTPLGPARPHLADYYETRRVESLIRAVQALRVAERDVASPAAPCVMEPLERFRPSDCFETRRWISTLAAQHMLRTGEAGALHATLHDAWWDVGDAARRSRQTGQILDNSLENWAQWMYLGWAFEPERHASVYLSLALDGLGMPRHATFHSLRAMVARHPDSVAPFMDVRNAARFSPPHWTYDSVKFGFEHLLDRLADGVTVGEAQVDEAREAVVDAYTWSLRKESALSRRTELLTLMTGVLQRLDALDPRTPE